jgi:hypothetical protein
MIETYQEVFSESERESMARLVAQGCRQAEQKRSMFKNQEAPCLGQALHLGLIASIEDTLMEACGSGVLPSKVLHCYSRKQNRFPYLEFMTPSGVRWHFKYSQNEGTLPRQSSYRMENASLLNRQLSLNFETLLDGTKYYKVNSGDVYAILVLGHKKLIPTFLKIIFPDSSYSIIDEAIDLTSYLKKEYCTEAEEEVIIEQKIVSSLKKTGIFKTGA